MFRNHRLMHWLSKVGARLNRILPRDLTCDLVQQPAWGRSREFDITTRTVGRNSLTQTTTGDLDDDEDDEIVTHDQRRRKVAFQPSPGMSTVILISGIVSDQRTPPETTHTIYYQGHWLRVSIPHR